MTKILVCDRSSYRITRREYTDEGFMRVPGHVARTGIQEYLARELGLDGDPNRIVKVYRPAEEVFHPDSLASYAGADITLNHPKGLVDAKNYTATSKGAVRGSGSESGIFVQCDLIVKAQDAIDAINSGKCELSAGYTAIYEYAPGVTADGEEYHYIQREIRINHVAIVDRARAGANARIFDENPTGGNTMPVLITTDSGRSVDVADPANAQVVADAFDRLGVALTTAKNDCEKHKAFADEAKEQLTQLTLLSSDEAIAARVEALVKVNATARRIAGDEFTCDGVDAVSIMRAAMTKARPKTDWSDKSEVYVQTAFDQAAEAAEEGEEEGTGKPPVATDSTSTLLAQLTQLALDGAATKSATDSAQKKVSSYDAHKASLKNAHKGK